MTVPDPGQQGRTECPECEGTGEKYTSPYPGQGFLSDCPDCEGSGLSPVAGKDRQEERLPPKWVEGATNRVRDLLQIETLPKHDSSSSAWQLACEIVDSIVPLVEGRQEPPGVTKNSAVVPNNETDEGLRLLALTKGESDWLWDMLLEESTADRERGEDSSWGQDYLGIADGLIEKLRDATNPTQAEPNGEAPKPESSVAVTDLGEEGAGVSVSADLVAVDREALGIVLRAFYSPEPGLSEEAVGAAEALDAALEGSDQ